MFGKKAAVPVEQERVAGVAQKPSPSSAGAAPSPATSLIQELQSTDDPKKKCELIKRLGKQRGGEVLEALVRALKDSDEKVRVYAVGSLQEVGDARAVEPLIEVLMTDKAHDPAYYATKALARFKTPRAVGGMVSALEAGRGDSSELAFQLGEVRAREAVDALCKLAESSGAEEAYARRHAVMSLANIGERRAVPALTKALKDEDAGVRERAQNALTSFGENPVQPFTHITGCIVHYPDLEQAQKDVGWLPGDLAARLPGADFDLGIAEVEDKDSYVVIVTSNDPSIRQVFRVEIYPKLTGKNDDTEWRSLEFSNEQKLPFYLGQGGKLLMHRYLPHASSTCP
jgi:hypothetical protein